MPNCLRRFAKSSLKLLDKRIFVKNIHSHHHYSVFLPTNSKMPVPDLSQYTLPNHTDLVFLDCAAAFKALTEKEKLYSHYLSQASWYGSLVCLYQCSPESPGIFVLLQKLFREEGSIKQLKELADKVGVDEVEFKSFLIYVAGFYANLGNYKSFGDTKFIPSVSQDKLEKLIKGSSAYKNDDEVAKLWNSIKDRMYILNEKTQQLGLGANGLSTYFSANCDTPDAELAQAFLDSKNLSAYNTRLFKISDKEYEVRLASSKTAATKESGDVDNLSVLGKHSFTPTSGNTGPVTFNVTRGDYSAVMKHLADNLAEAKNQSANEHESSMLAEYVRSFTEGSIESHKDGSRHWIRNKGPIIETYIGFIESYRDPFGVRGEFEGFVACVNKKMSAKFGELVEKAEHFLPLLPWPASYEKDEFLRPDFTSLDVLTFGSSGIPAGINIPNYDDIRQSEGFKNVSLGNVLSSSYKEAKDKITFLGESDKELMAELKAPAFEVQVGLHELLGHGSGKLFVKKKDGVFNFDQEKVTNLLTGEKISSWYNEGETWDSKFAALSSSYEECRAECVGIYLCLSAEVLTIFGHEGSAADDIIYINWLNMVRAGLMGLEFYTPESDKWRQAHMQARYVILRVLLEAGEGLVTLETPTNPDDGQPDLLLKLDRSKINSVGKKAIGDFLAKIQLYKSTADYPAAKKMYDYYSAVHDCESPHFISLRSIVLARKQPRKMFVQANTAIKDGAVQLEEYPPTPEGMIESFRKRFPGSMDRTIQELWEKDAPLFPC